MEQLNRVGQNQQKPLKKLEDLEKYTPYYIIDVRKVVTKFGESYLIETNDFNVFLPKRFSKFTEENMKILCGKYLVYDGKKDNMNLISFPEELEYII